MGRAPDQVGRVFPELRANVGFLWENRKLWNEMYLADIEADASKAPADKEADRVGCILLLRDNTTNLWYPSTP